MNRLQIAMSLAFLALLATPTPSSAQFPGACCTNEAQLLSKLLRKGGSSKTGSGEVLVLQDTPTIITPDVTSYISMGGIKFLDAFTATNNYHGIWDGAGNLAIQLGDGTDTKNYYKNDTHQFTSRNGSTIFGNITSGGVGVRSTGASFDLRWRSTEALTTNRTITWNVGDADRAITIGGGLNIGGSLTTASSFATAGANALTLTTTGATNVTLPTSGTVVSSASTNVVTNAMASQMAANTIKGNNTGSTANAADLTLAQAVALLKTTQLEAHSTVDFSAAGDTAITVPPLPTGYTRYSIRLIFISGASANVSAATFGAWTAAGGTGYNLIAAGTTPLVTTASEDTIQNAQAHSIIGVNSVSFAIATVPIIYFRVGATAAGTASVTVTFQALP